MIRLFAFVLFSLPYLLLAQQRKAFSISGHSTFYNGQRLFIQGGVLSTFNYNDFNFVQETVDTVYKSFSTVLVQHNQFTINGFQKYPHPFQVSIYDATTESGTSSQFFFADAGAVDIEINDLFTNKYLGNQLLSKSNKEYQHLKKLYSNTVDTLNGKVHDFKAKQKTIQKYITQHPNSYVALWDLVIDYAIYKNWKNDDDIKMILKNALLLSSTIKKTTTYKTLLENIKKDLELSSGKTFPNIRLNSTDSLIPIVKKNKFTLVDFWFSGCVPCVRQFPSYKVSYDLNKSKGFEIIGISIDGKKEEADWHKIIQTMKLNWLQYLATNNLTRKLHISGFPTNYLLDNEGKIIKVNIEPEELERFLQQNLH
jgi:thiol-disulfide isomerase/thioredoxin